MLCRSKIETETETCEHDADAALPDVKCLFALFDPGRGRMPLRAVIRDELSRERRGSSASSVKKAPRKTGS